MSVLPSVMSVHLIVCMEELSSHWMDFHEILYLRTYWKSVTKLQVSLKPDRNSGNCRWKPMYLWYHAEFFTE